MIATALTGVVVPGDGRGRGLGFPTANLRCEGAELPADGIYAAWAEIDGDGAAHPASVSIGANPTFDGVRPRRVEVYLHDVDLDLYGRQLSVRIVAFLRPTLRFEGVDALVAQAAVDVARCRGVLAEQPPR